MWAVWWGEPVPLQTHLTIVHSGSHFSGCYVNRDTLLSMSLLSWQSELGFSELSSQEVVRIKRHHRAINNNYYHVTFILTGAPGCSRFRRAFPGMRTGKGARANVWWLVSPSRFSEVSQALSAAVNQHSRALKTHQVSHSPTKTQIHCQVPHAARSFVLRWDFTQHPRGPHAGSSLLMLNEAFKIIHICNFPC